MARVFLDWGAGSGMREVGVTDHIPTDVLLATDLGSLVSHYVPASVREDSHVPSIPCESAPLVGTSAECCDDDITVCTNPINVIEMCTNSIADDMHNLYTLDETDTSEGSDVYNQECAGIQSVPTTTDAQQVGGRDCQYLDVGTQQGRGYSDRESGNPPAVCTPATGRGAADSPQLPQDIRTDELLPVSSPRDWAQCQAAMLTDRTVPVLSELVDGIPAGSDTERLTWEQGRLYRQTIPTEDQPEWWQNRQLVVPRPFRERLLQVAYEIPLAGHLGIRNNPDRLKPPFNWPGMEKEVTNLGHSLIIRKGMEKSGPGSENSLIPLPIMNEPFQRVAVDNLGPVAIPHRSGKGVTRLIVHCASRYPEAGTVAHALLTIVSGVEFPRELRTDQSTQGMSNGWKYLCKQIQVPHLVAGVYHPQTTSLCERFSNVLQQTLRRLVKSQGRDWERYLPHLLFPYREIPLTSTGFSPFGLPYGKRVWGPLDLRGAWEGPSTIHQRVNAVDDVDAIDPARREHRVFPVSMINAQVEQAECVMPVDILAVAQDKGTLAEAHPGSQLMETQKSQQWAVLDLYLSNVPDPPGRTKRTDHHGDHESQTPGWQSAGLVFLVIRIDRERWSRWRRDMDRWINDPVPYLKGGGVMIIFSVY